MTFEESGQFYLGKELEGQLWVLEQRGRLSPGHLFQGRYESRGQDVLILIIAHDWADVMDPTALRHGANNDAIQVPGYLRFLELAQLQEEFCLVFEYAAGKPLHVLLDERMLLPVPLAFRLTVEVARILHELHEAGRPLNVCMEQSLLVDGEEVSMLSAKLWPPLESIGDRQLSLYTSREGLAGNGGELISGTAMVAMLFSHLITGEHPYAAAEIAMMVERIKIGDANPLRAIDSSLPDSLEAFCLRSMGKDRSKRPESPAAFCLELQEELATLTGHGMTEDWQIPSEEQFLLKELARKVRVESVVAVNPDPAADSDFFEYRPFWQDPIFIGGSVLLGLLALGMAVWIFLV